MLLRTLAVAGGLAAALIAVPAADAASNGTYLYDVTVKAEMKDQWSFRDEGEIGTPWEPCHVAHVGEGSALWQLHSRRPTRVMVMKGFGGRPPALNVGTGEGVPLTGVLASMIDGDSSFAQSSAHGGPEGQSSEGSLGTALG